MDKHNPRRGELITFADDKERWVYPLNIKALRKFVKVVTKMTEIENAVAMTDEDIDLMMDAAEIIVRQADAELAADRDLLEEAVDLPCFNRMMAVAMGAASPEA